MGIEHRNQSKQKEIIFVKGKVANGEEMVFLQVKVIWRPIQPGTHTYKTMLYSSPSSTGRSIGHSTMLSIQKCQLYNWKVSNRVK